MKKRSLLLTMTLILHLMPAPTFAAQKCEESQQFTIVIHGGAGSWRLPEKEREEYVRTFMLLLREARKKLALGASSLEIAEWAVSLMEDSPLFNAGKGSVANSEGVFELDASIMDGATMSAGAVAAVKTIKNPIRAARAVMNKSPHVLLAGAGADQFAKQQGLSIVSQDYFRVPETRPFKKYGTVGAVVLDRCGDLAAATSTGGMAGKMPGRVGDTPIVGAGTYAKNGIAALSGTGHGEFFLRYTVTRDIAALMEYVGLPLQEAADRVIKQVLPPVGGEGGVIGVDVQGRAAVSYNTPGMIHGLANERDEPTVDF